MLSSLWHVVPSVHFEAGWKMPPRLNWWMDSWHIVWFRFASLNTMKPLKCIFMALFLPVFLFKKPTKQDVTLHWRVCWCSVKYLIIKLWGFQSWRFLMQSVQWLSGSLAVFRCIIKQSSLMFFASPTVKDPNLKQKSGDLLECFTALHFQLFIIFFCVCIFSLCTLLIRIKKGTMKTSTNCPMTTSEDLRYICMVNARRPPTFQT